MQSPLEEIQQYVWRRLGIRKYMVKRETINDLVEIAAANWNHEYLTNATEEKERKIVVDAMIADIKRTHQMLGQYDSAQEYGFIWAILLQALVGAIVQIMLKWWLESAKNRILLWAVKKELAG